MTIDRDAVHPKLHKRCQSVKWKNILFAEEDFVIANNARQEVLEIYFVDDRERFGIVDFDEDVRSHVSSVIHRINRDDVIKWARDKIAERAPALNLTYSLDRFEAQTPRM